MSEWPFPKECETCGVELITAHEGRAGKCYRCIDDLIRDRQGDSEDEVCPACGEKLVEVDKSLGYGDKLFCTNPECRVISVQKEMGPQSIGEAEKEVEVIRKIKEEDSE